MSEQVVDAGNELLTNPYVRQIVVQLRALDSYGTYDTWTDDKVLDPLILTKERRREIPVVGDPDETVVARVKAYYNALAVSIEAQTGLMAVPFINLTHEGFGRALIIIGKLVVLDKTLRDIHRFGFDSLEKLVEDMDKLVLKAVTLTREHEAVATL
ncbi:NifX-associated nitrogen fixation protein [Parathalassolituus penaei]|uniref:NifX-associated nitrogen fixation protein n=1 Tax=Parathalassolituus penaei TaxID=2997323 RepID=A0A9X3EF60_9GAMM|nr:NifX-associated nitrogen fixation protein [Parathalassolituus penaei]MCY0965629.1 NifX-associated nitrogen fixation protein [Parathalassolituus penaei]